jgi:hypothetical protein
VGLEDVIVGEPFCRCELPESFVDSSCKGRMLEPPYDVEIFYFFEIAQVTRGLVIAERVEGHGLVSLRYLA